MRLPYTSSSNLTSPTTLPILSRLQAPHPLQPLDLALLHSPPIADGWNSFLDAIRTQTSLPASIRELIICRIAVLNGAEYEWVHHAPLLKSEGGFSEAQLCMLEGLEAGKGKRKEGEEGFSEEQWAVLDYTDQMTVGCMVEERVWERLKKGFGEKEVVEITATCAAYNCVSRFLVALDVGEMNGNREAFGTKVVDTEGSNEKVDKANALDRCLSASHDWTLSKLCAGQKNIASLSSIYYIVTP